MCGEQAAFVGVLVVSVVIVVDAAAVFVVLVLVFVVPVGLVDVVPGVVVVTVAELGGSGVTTRV